MLKTWMVNGDVQDVWIIFLDYFCWMPTSTAENLWISIVQACQIHAIIAVDRDKIRDRAPGGNNLLIPGYLSTDYVNILGYTPDISGYTGITIVNWFLLMLFGYLATALLDQDVKTPLDGHLATSRSDVWARDVSMEVMCYEWIRSWYHVFTCQHQCFIQRVHIIIWMNMGK